MWPFKKKKKTLQETIMEDAFNEESFNGETLDLENVDLSVEGAVAEDLGLEDIMKEFSEVEAAAEADAVPCAEVTSDTVRLDLPVKAEAPVVTGDTIRMEPVVTEDTVRIDPVVTDDTVRIDPVVTEDTVRVDPMVTGDTIRMEPVITEDAQQSGGVLTDDTVRFEPIAEAPVDEPKKAEPFSEGWEPEYEQPMGEYVPPQPIIFQPKSRLRELKRKLVNGPERRYYELIEQGCIRLQFAILVSLLVAVLSIGTTVVYELGMLVGRLKLVTFLQLFCMLIAALMGTYQLMDGVADMFKKRFSLNSLLVFGFLACIADGVFCLQAQRIPCCAAFSIQMTMSLWATYHRRSTETGQMDTMRKATRLDSLVEVKDYFEGSAGYLRGEGQVEDFMDHYNARSKADKITTIYAMIALGVSLITGVVAGVLRNSIELGVQALAVSLLAAVPGTFFITTTRPLALLERRLHRLGTVLCGWENVEKLDKQAVFPLHHLDIFPAGSCMLNGVKFYGDRDPDQIVAYSTAVVKADGGGLTPLFEQMLTSRNGRRYKVENLRLYGEGGIGGEVCGEPVLVGMLSFLKDMGVEIPAGTMVNQAVYVAVDGELCGVFAVSATRTKAAASGLNTLCSYRNLRPILVSGDFLLTEDFLKEKFGVNTRRVGFPDFQARSELAKKQVTEDAPVLALATRDGLSAYAYAVTGARSLNTASRIGMIIHLLGGGLGMATILLLALLNAGGLMTPVNMLLYQLVWMIPGLLVTEWTRSL